MSVEFNLNVQVEGPPWYSTLLPFPTASSWGLHLFDEDGLVPFPLDLLILQNGEPRRSTNCPLATRDCLPWNIFDMLLLNSNLPARLRMRRAKGLKGSEPHPAALKLASDQATTSLKILQWLRITPRRKTHFSCNLPLPTFSASSHTPFLLPSLPWIPLNLGVPPASGPLLTLFPLA